MIEVIYDRDKQSEDGQTAGEEKREERSRDKDLKLPKNIRQIGNPSSNKRIYIEDYVVTYLNYISRPGSTHARGAVLLGTVEHSEIGDIIFVSGAVDAQNLEFDMDESAFTQEAWTEIYDQVKEFFSDLAVVGWFLSRMGFSTAINDKIEKMHVDNFPGKDKVLYVSDSLESDDAFYMYEHGQLVKQKGYYIYYTKNEAMQNYIIKQKGGTSDEEDTEIQRKDEELIRNYREKNNKSQGTKPGGISLVYVASSFVVLAMLAMGITVISNYDKMKEMEVSINKLELTAEEPAVDDAAEVLATEEPSGLTASISDALEEDGVTTGSLGDNQADPDNEGGVSDDDSGEGEDTDTITTAAQEISIEQTLPAMTNGNPTYYVIQYGDSLSSIALKQYGAVKYAEDIAKANNMDIDDRIYEGEQIILPSVTPR
ncbi:MAG: LysM peptidoglycan-binding domain-containing protein [Wujia sp.]